jgi:phosphomannomutase
VGGVVFDKDGVSAAAVLVEHANQLAGRGLTLWGYLHKVYQKYGRFNTHNGYFRVEDPAVVERVFGRLRQGGQYLQQLGGHKVTWVRDLTRPGYDTKYPDKKPRLPVSSSNMITFEIEGGLVVTLRTSGTEPKVKYYIETQGSTEEEQKRLVGRVLEDIKGGSDL